MANLLDPNPDDLAQLQGLLTQFQPTQADKDAARKQAQMQFFLGLLGAPKGGEFQRIGQSGIGAMQTYQDRIKQEQALRGQNIQAASQVMQMMRQQAVARQMADLMGGGGATMQPGPAQPFPTPGGSSAASIMNAGASGTSTPSEMLPTQVRAPMSEQDRFNAMNKLNLMNLAAGGKDFSAAINAANPAPIALRQGAAAIDRFGNIINPNPSAPAGFFYDPKQNKYVKVGNATEAEAQAQAVPKAVSLAYEPQQGIIPGGGEGVVGNKLDALFPNGQYPFLNGLSTGAAPAAPPPAPPAGPTAPRVPVQTKLSPEQEATQKNASEYEQGVHAAALGAQQENSRLEELKRLATYFSSGPTLPARANLAGYAQEAGAPGRFVADMLVPNSKTALPAIQAFNKLGVQMVAQQAKVFGSREAVQIVEMVRSAIPNAGMVEGAPQTIISFMEGMNKYATDAEKALAAYKKQNNGSAVGFQEYLHQALPVESYIPKETWLSMQKLAAGQPSAPAAPVAPAGKSIVRTGTYNGKRVVQYSDGTTEYAQ